MNNQFNLVIGCKHNRPDQIVLTTDGESVCRCGVVLEEKMSIATSTTQTGARTTTLYHQVENGGDPKDMKIINKKIHIYASSASEFSNICDKLDLHSFVQQRAWRIYHTLRTRTYYTRAKCAVLAIYVACRESGNAVDEAQIKDAVRSILGVKNIPSVLGVISQMHEDVLKLGINTNEGHSSSYYLNLAITKKQHMFGDSRDYDRFKIRVTNNFAHLSGNHKSKAQRAVDIALEEMGMTT